MGVYHLMGLGRSPGAVTGPLSYLAHRYLRWNEDDQRFFARSGEAIQRQEGKKVGDVQGLVAFTTPEVFTGMEANRPFATYDYIENTPGRITEAPLHKGGAAREVLGCLLKREWPNIAGGRDKGTVFWCQVDRRDIRITYERVVQVVAALARVGGQGKEMWANLTGGNNVINFALELAATLSGDVARLYYVQAENVTAEKCVRFTAENGYWVDLPVMPLALSRLSRAVLDFLSQRGVTDSKTLYSHLCSEHWNLMEGVSFESFGVVYLRPMWKQGLVAETKVGYAVGQQWELIQPYVELLQHARQADVNIEQLAQQRDWIQKEEIGLVSK